MLYGGRTPAVRLFTAAARVRGLQYPRFPIRLLPPLGGRGTNLYCNPLYDVHGVDVDEFRVAGFFPLTDIGVFFGLAGAGEGGCFACHLFGMQ